MTIRKFFLFVSAIILCLPGSAQSDETKGGKVSQEWYPSSFSSEMTQRRLSIYLPAEYGEDKEKHYPVLYLLHGTGGDEMSWIREGRLVEIMDSMIAVGGCPPMIVVMPNGIAYLDATPGESPYMNEMVKSSNVESWFGRTEAAFPKEVVPFIETGYRTLNDKSHRAIAGLSMGGMHAMAISCNNPEMFDYVGLFSPQTRNILTDGSIRNIEKSMDWIESAIGRIPYAGDALGEEFEKRKENLGDISIYDDIDGKMERQFEDAPSLYYIAIGRDDPLKVMCDKFRKRMSKKGFPYYYQETDGGHDWNNWQNYLIDFLSRIFGTGKQTNDL